MNKMELEGTAHLLDELDSKCILYLTVWGIIIFSLN